MPIDRKLALLSQKLVGSHKASRPINGSEGWTDLLFLFIIHSCPQLGKTLLADGMLHQAGFLFGLAIWLTCLLGPVALIRYVLSLYYLVPVLWAAMLAPGEKKA